MSAPTTTASRTVFGMTVAERAAVIQQLTVSVIAVLVVLGTFAIIGFQVVNHEAAQVPDVVAALVGGVVTAFLTHTAAMNGARAAGTAAAQTAMNGAQSAALKPAATQQGGATNGTP